MNKVILQARITGSKSIFAWHRRAAIVAYSSNYDFEHIRLFRYRFNVVDRVEHIHKRKFDKESLYLMVFVSESQKTFVVFFRHPIYHPLEAYHVLYQTDMNA